MTGNVILGKDTLSPTPQKYSFLHRSCNLRYDKKCKCDQLRLTNYANNNVTVCIIPCIVNLCVASFLLSTRDTHTIPYLTSNNIEAKFYDLHEHTG